MLATEFFLKKKVTWCSYRELPAVSFRSGHIWFVAAWSFFISRARREAKMFLLDGVTPTRKSKKIELRADSRGGFDLI